MFMKFQVKSTYESSYVVFNNSFSTIIEYCVSKTYFWNKPFTFINILFLVGVFKRKQFTLLALQT